MEIISEKKEDKQMLMVLHLSQLLNFITGLGGIIIPILLWQLKKDEIKQMDEQAKEVINFQISFYIYYIIAGILCLLLIGFIILPILILIGLILPILNGIKANNGEPVKYPLTIQFIK
ncbi:hypothetical protein SAMN04488096_10619 [Mesonia phycicola]|uniref:DUF4870 domain-containing protein n=1 Tax=Mesonia phycicola TaxID=579105 RepID=A0A1M6F9R2_9FLAO|nr:DUF4870 domain-containing protein [Mesonia phycicola]SHI94396.1 hypothetical protein SAMN04488096_10619 [Mesonia phycicola]